VYDYAALCAPPTGSSAAALAAAAVHQVLRGLERFGPVAALRPHLLMTVRDIAGVWAAGPHITPGPAHSLPAPHAPDGPAPPEAVTGAGVPGRDAGAGRRLALSSFQSMSATAQCLLWHTVVEAEPVSGPAALLALDIGTALTELQEARSQFRSGLLHVHAELAVHGACRFYNRLLDIQTRRGRTLLPDVRHHLLVCPHCADAALELSLCERGLGLLLAQAVLGPAAEDYLASRPARRPARADVPAQTTPRPVRGRRPGRHRLVPPGLPTRPVPPARTSPKTLLTGVGLASAFALGAVLTAALWPSESTGARPLVPGGAGTTRSESDAPDMGVPPSDVPPMPTPAAFTSGSGPITGARGPAPATVPLTGEGSGTHKNSAAMRSGRR
jgi:hypothetical protein